MYENFYGLTTKPFQLNPDPLFYFASKQHRRAKAYLEYGVLRNEGFIIITGEVGAGKTTIVRSLLDSLDADKVVAGNLVTTQLDAEDTLRMVGAAFGVRTKDSSKADILLALEAFFVSQTSLGKRCLLIIDEAQNLTPRAVEELRMLSNFQFGKQSLLQSFLIGQPEFRDILQNPNMQQLRQRVIAACHIGPMDLEETQGYIEHRLKCAGWTERPYFSATAFESIFDASGGIPRRINLICDRLLLLGFLENKNKFEEIDVKNVANEILEESGHIVGKNYFSSEIKNNLIQSDVSVNLIPSQGLNSSSLERVKGMEEIQFNNKIDGLEQGILRLEKNNYEILGVLKSILISLEVFNKH
ncbi:XrtA/PEP-CTERM system-associated ATPase [Rhodoferax sp.]|uniref:XrtA/PEP-CTERM system-associated ATPase n=1 Tax=Rhodoferax sp. TaxID=50421 RepID=UPI0025F916FB|nr:XrtA/PEP-CTERM system-associated ATPase [Rhodoferax sp.]